MDGDEMVCVWYGLAYPSPRSGEAPTTKVDKPTFQDRGSSEILFGPFIVVVVALRFCLKTGFTFKLFI